MKIGRFEFEGRAFYGMIEGATVREMEGYALFDTSARLGARLKLKDLKFLPPLDPPNVICIGLNYKLHAVETSENPPTRPEIFLKLTTSVTAHGATVALPAIASDEIDCEAELCVIIGEAAKDVLEDEAMKHVFGYCCGNDISARDCQTRLDKQWARGKSMDGFCPLGPWIETDLDPSALKIEGMLNGQVKQKASTKDMIFSVPRIISYLSHNFTILPGTVIMTGTPGGVGFARRPPIFMRPGDVYEVSIEGIGRLSNRFAASTFADPEIS
ncbi:MAG: fumarylacetoacetate hydrolase family protein [Clostridiales bacterium]|nr:fumarylacetoacetate hydrolase family protein [Clostridiales bacterium]MDR2750261.1 fumarylacetoacetate hydrolase family protein [Clostridiales bacterium]